MNNHTPFRVIIDTNILVALIDENDKWHKKALKIHDVLKKNNADLVFFDAVINETVTVIGRRFEEKGLTEKFSSTFLKLKSLLCEENITWISQETKRLYQNILDLVQEHQGKLNFHDALIALVAQESEIKYIATFDTDFKDIKWFTLYNLPADEI